MDNSLINELASSLTESNSLITDLTGYDKYRHDATNLHGDPSAIVFAINETDIVNTVNFCRKHKIALVARGAGTGLSGGAVPTKGSIVISLEKMTDIRIDPASKTGYVQAGAITKSLMDQAAVHNLSYPPDPASFEESTIGGNIAENAGGLRCKKFGLTRDYVIGLKAVTQEGGIIKTGVYNKRPGFNFTDLLIGSEGTLAIIFESAHRLIPKQSPGETILAAFDKAESAAKAVAEITADGIIPIVMEYLDGDAAACSNRYEKTDGFDNAAAVLIIEANKNDAQIVENFCVKNSCSFFRRENDPVRVNHLWKIRRNLSKAVTDIADIRISEDVAVPISKFPALVAFVDNMNKKSPLRINSFGHAGDGNLHVNFLSMTGEENDRKLIGIEIENLLKKAIDLGGTLSGEHGIGLEKKKYLHLEFDKSTLLYMKKLKNIFDPDNFINPTKIF